MIIDGRKISQIILKELKSTITENNLKPKLKIILASNDEPSKMYVRMKRMRAEEIGVEVEIQEVPENVTKEEIISIIDSANKDNMINGILVQLPLFSSLEIHRSEILNRIDSTKDLDGLTSSSLGNITQQFDTTFIPATVLGILFALSESFGFDFSNFSINADTYLPVEIVNKLDTHIKGVNVTIVNNSSLIGRPLSVILSQLNGSVSVLNIYTRDLKSYTTQADILVIATGNGNLIDHTYVKENCTVIDVTSIKVDDKIIGDVMISDEFVNKVRAYTPVPGGVGPLTIASLLYNLVYATLKTTYQG